MITTRIGPSYFGKTDWKANTFWSPRQRIEVIIAPKRPVRVRTTSQAPSSQALHAVASFLSNWQLQEPTQLLDQCHIHADPDRIDPEKIANILAQKDKALSSIKKELLGYISSLIQKSASTSIASPVESTPAKPSLSIPAKTTLQKHQKKQVTAEESFKQRLLQIQADLATLFGKEKETEKLSWLGKLYEKGESLAFGLFPGLKTWAKQAADFLALPLPCPEEDLQDKALMLRCAAQIAQSHAEIEQLAKQSHLSPALKKECEALRHKLEEMQKKISWLHRYFSQCEELDDAMDKGGDQMLDLQEGKFNFSTENYQAIIKQIQAFESLSKEGFENPAWQERIKRKCDFQVTQACHYLEDLGEQVHSEMHAEIEESIDHLKEIKAAAANEAIPFFKALQIVHMADLCGHAIETDSLHFLEQLKVLADPCSGKTRKHLDQLYACLKVDYNDLEKTKQNFPVKFCLDLLIKRLSRLKDPETLLFSFLPSQRVKDPFVETQALYVLTVLEYFGKAIQGTPEVSPLLSSAATKLMGKVAQEKSGYKKTFEELLEAIRQNRPILTDAKRRALESHKRTFETDEYSPTQKTILRVAFTYLQAWDLFSPILGKLINPIGKRDYGFYVNMMARTKDKNSTEYHQYFERARSFHEADQEFLTMFDRFVRGDMTFGFTKRSFSDFEAAPSLAGTLGETVRPFVPETLSTWFSKFFATDLEDRSLLNASEWEKWAYHHIYPDILSQAYDQLIKSFETYNPHVAASSKNVVLTGAPQEAALTSSCYELYQKATEVYKYPNDIAMKSAYDSALAIAKRQVGPLGKYLDAYETHLQAYLKANKLSFSSQAQSLDTLPLGRAVLTRLEEDTHVQMQVEELSNFYGKAAGKREFQKIEAVIAEQSAVLKNLRKRFPLEISSIHAIQAWLKQLEAARRQYAQLREEMRALFAAVEWKEVISLEKLKLFLKNPLNEKVDEDLLSHIMGEHFIDHQQPLHPLYHANWQLQILKQRIQVLAEQPLCPDTKPTTFCAEYLKNTALQRLAGQSPILSFLENLEQKFQQALLLQKAFLSGPEGFYTKWQTVWNALKPNESAFFITDNIKFNLFELIKQPDGLITLRFYDLSDHQWHLKIIAEGQEQVRPYVEINNVSPFWREDLWKTINQIDQQMSWDPDALEALLKQSGGSLNLQEKPQDLFVSSSQKGFFHTLMLAFKPYFSADGDLSRFEYESQFKAIHTYHQLYNNQYTASQRKFIQAVCQSFAGKLDKWHEKKIINGEEVKFTIDFLEEIHTSLQRQPKEPSPLLQIPAKVSTLFIEPSFHNSAEPFFATKEASENKWINTFLESLSFVNPKEVKSTLATLAKPPYDSRKIESYIKSLPLTDPSFWQQADCFGDIDLFKKLSLQYEILIKSASSPTKFISAYLVPLKILTIVDILTKQSPPASLGMPLPLYSPVFDQIFENEPFILSVADSWSEEFLALKSYWKEQGSNSIFGDYSSPQPFSEEEEKILNEKRREVSEGELQIEKERLEITEESSQLALRRQALEKEIAEIAPLLEKEQKLLQEIESISKLEGLREEQEGLNKEYWQKIYDLRKIQAHFVFDEGIYWNLLKIWKESKTLYRPEILKYLDKAKQLRLEKEERYRKAFSEDAALKSPFLEEEYQRISSALQAIQDRDAVLNLEQSKIQQNDQQIDFLFKEIHSFETKKFYDLPRPRDLKNWGEAILREKGLDVHFEEKKRAIEIEKSALEKAEDLLKQRTIRNINRADSLVDSKNYLNELQKPGPLFDWTVNHLRLKYPADTLQVIQSKAACLLFDRRWKIREGSSIFFWRPEELSLPSEFFELRDLAYQTAFLYQNPPTIKAESLNGIELQVDDSDSNLFGVSIVKEKWDRKATYLVPTKEAQFEFTRDMLFGKDIPSLFSYWQPKGETFKDDFKLLLKKLNLSDSSPSQVESNLIDVREFVKKIPLKDPDFWKNLNLHGNDVSLFKELSQKYYDLCKNKPKEATDYLVHIKILVLADKLIHQSPPDSLGEAFSLYNPIFDKFFSQEEVSFQLHDPEWDVDFQLLKNYWNKEKNSFFDAHLLFKGLSGTQSATIELMKSEIARAIARALGELEAQKQYSEPDLPLDQFKSHLTKEEFYQLKSIEADLVTENALKDAKNKGPYTLYLRGKIAEEEKKLQEILSKLLVLYSENLKPEVKLEDLKEEYEKAAPIYLESKNDFYFSFYPYEEAFWHISETGSKDEVTDFISAYKNVFETEFIQKFISAYKNSIEEKKKVIIEIEQQIEKIKSDQQKFLLNLESNFATSQYGEFLKYEKEINHLKTDLKEKKEDLIKKEKFISSKLLFSEEPEKFWLSFQKNEFLKQIVNLDKQRAKVAEITAEIAQCQEKVREYENKRTELEGREVGHKKNLDDYGKVIDRELTRIDTELAFIGEKLKPFQKEIEKLEKVKAELKEKANGVEEKIVKIIRFKMPTMSLNTNSKFFEWMGRWVERQEKQLKTIWESQSPTFNHFINNYYRKVVLAALSEEVKYSPKNKGEYEFYSSPLNLPREYFDLQELSFFTLFVLEGGLDPIGDVKKIRKKPVSTSIVIEGKDSNHDVIGITEEETVSLFDFNYSLRIPHDPHLKSIGLKKLLFDSSGGRLRFPPNIIPIKTTWYLPSSSDSLEKRRVGELFGLSSFPETQFKNTVSYFTKHIELLRQKDIQELCHFLLFEPGLFLEELRKSPEDNRKFIEDLTGFLQKVFSFGLDWQDASLISFILRVNERLKISFEKAYENNPQAFPIEFKQTFLDSRKEWRQLINSPEVSYENKSVFYRDLAWSYSQQPDLSVEDMKEALKADIGFHLYEISPGWMDLNVPKRDKSAVLKTALLGPQRDEILNAAYLHFYPHAHPHKWRETSFPHFVSADGQVKINVLEGELTVEKGQTVYLPQAIKESWLFREIAEMKDIRTGKKVDVDAAQGDVYEIIAPKGIKYRIIKNSKEPDFEIIQREIDGQWHQRREDKKLFNEPKWDLNSFIADYEVWWRPKPFSLYLQTPKGELKYRFGTYLTGKVGLFEVTPDDKDTGVSLGDLPSKVFEGFENPQFIFAFRNEATQALASVHFKRFGLQFTPHEVEGKIRLKCEQLPAFLAESQEIPSLEHARPYLVLEGKRPSGEIAKMVLFLPQPLEPLSSAWETKTESSSSQEKAPAAKPYFLYDVDSNTQALISRDESGRLYLAMLMLWKQDYKEAYQLLDQFSSSTQKLKPEEAQTLHWLVDLQSKNHDRNPKANAVRLKALALLLQNEKKFPTKASGLKIEETKVLHDYADYLQAEDQCQLFTLRPEEEILIIREYASQIDVLDEFNHHLILQRMQKLSMPISQDFAFMRHFETVQRPTLKRVKLRYSDIHVKNFKIDEQFLSDYAFIWQMTSKSWLQVRQFVAQKTQASLFFSWLRPVDTLRHYLTASQNSYSKETSLQHLLLQAVLRHPEQFPAVLPVDKNGQVEAKYFNEKVCKPLGKLVLNEPDFQNAFRIIPKALDSVSDSVERLDSPFDASLDRKGPDIRLLLQTSMDFFLNDRLSKVFAAKDNLSNSTVQEALMTLNAKLEKHEKKLKQELRDLKADLLITANSATSPFEEALQRSQAMSQKNEPFSIDKLIYLFLKREASLFHKQNPSLTLNESGEIFEKIKNFLLLSIHQKHVEAVKSLVDSATKTLHKGIKSTEAKEAIQELAQEIARERQFSIIDHPEYLVLEYYAGFLLRKNQLSNLNDLKIERGSITAPAHLGKAIELVMGAGKTSVIFPLLAMLNADGRRFAMGVMPKRLMVSMFPKLQSQLSKAFSQSLEVMHFDRYSRFDEIGLEYILDKFHEIKNSKKFLLIANESIQSLFLKMAEKLSAYVDAKQKNEMVYAYEKEISLFIEIFKFFKESGSVLIDEIDFILDVLKSFHFTIGPSQRLVEVNPILTKTSKDFYSFLATTPELGIALKFTTKKSYKKIKKAIIQAILSGQFKTDREWDIFINKLSDEHKPIIERFLKGEIQPDTLKFTNTLDNKIQDILAVLMEEINDLLPLTTSKNLYEHYGPSEDLLKGGMVEGNELLAIPYHQGRRSSKGTQFGTELEILGYTYQMYLEMGLPVSIVQAELKALQEKLSEELLAKKSDAKTIKELDSYRAFLKLTNHDPRFELNKLSEADYGKIAEIIKASPAKVLDLVYKHVITEIPFYEKQLNADSQLFGTLFKEIQGMSGTLWNAKTFPTLITSVKSSDTSEKTLSLLHKNSPSKVTVVDKPAMLNEEKLKAFLKKIVQQDPNPSSFIDAANILRGVSNELVARKLLEIAQETGWNIHGVVFYDQDDNLKVVQHIENNWEVWDLENSRLSKDHLLVYWDQSHTTGSDVKLHANMKAAVSIGRHTFLRDLLQAVWRLRRLDKSQKAYFVITKEDEIIIRETLQRESILEGMEELTLTHLIRYTAIKQAQRQGSDNYRSFKQKMQALLLDKALQSIFTAGSPEVAGEIYALCRDLFETTQKIRPYELYVKSTQELPKDQAIRKEVKDFLNSPLVEAFKKSPLSDKWDINVIEKEIKQLAKKEFKHMPEYIVHTDMYSRERSVQTQQQTLTQKHTNVELSVDSVASEDPPAVKPSEKPIFRAAPVYEWDGLHDSVPDIQQVLIHEGYTDIAQAFDSRMGVSRNLAYDFNMWNWDYALRKVSLRDRTAPFGMDYKSLNQVLVFQNKETGKLNLILLDTYDEKVCKKQLLLERYDKDLISPLENRYALYDMTTGIYIQNRADDEDRIDPKQLEADPKFLHLKVQVKFLNGDLSYSPAELAVLEKWLVAKGPEKLEKFFRETIADWRFIDPKAIDKSILGDLFNRLAFTSKVSSSHFTQYFKVPSN